MLALNLAGTPLGLLDGRGWARDPEEYGRREVRACLHVEEKESRKWLVGFQSSATA